MPLLQNGVVCLLFVIMVIAIAPIYSGQPSYQVSVFVSLHPRAAPFHMCNGVILQSRVILTAASCTFYQFRAHDPPIPIEAARISILAGNTNADDVSSLAIPVKEIHIASDFNVTTKENDVAMLLLGTSLPLAMRDDMKWIVLDDNEHENNTCYGSFYARNSLDTVPDYEQTQELPISEKETCNQTDELRSRDLCSTYSLPLNFECEEYNEFLHMNGDRGAGLVCNSRLVAILSTILPLSSANNSSDREDDQAPTNCSALAVSAVYTALGPHLDWIYGVVAYEEYLDLSENNYISAAPYQHNVSAVDQPGSAGIASTESGADVTEIDPQLGSTATNTISSTARPIVNAPTPLCRSAGGRTVVPRSVLDALLFAGVTLTLALALAGQQHASSRIAAH